MPVTQLKEWLTHNFSRRAFLQGLICVVVLYAILGLWVWLNTGNVLQMKEDRLASQTVKIDWIEPDTPEAIESVETYKPPETLDSGLTKAPIDGLYRQGEYGLVPIIRKEDGLTPFQAYRRPFDRYGIDAPIISLAISNIGLSDSASESAIRSMPSEISLILSPYSKLRDFWTTEARARGHEIWMTLPMEPMNYPLDDPGPHTMLVDVPDHENELKMEWLLSRAHGYVGFVGSANPLFMNSIENMRPVIDRVYRSGLAFIDTSAVPGKTSRTMALGRKAPYGTVDVWIDEKSTSRQDIQEALSELEMIAQRDGTATGILHTLPVSYQEVLEWVNTLPDKGIVLAPLSAQVTY